MAGGVRWLIGLAALVPACGRIGFDLAHDASGDALPPIPGMIGWWKLDDATGTIARDSAGTADGALVVGNTSDVPGWTAGQHQGAIAFVGDGDRIELGTPAAFANLPALTITAWVKPTSITAAVQQHCVMDKGDSASGWVFNLFDLAAGDLSFRDYRSVAGEVSRTSVGGRIATGVWSHVAASWDGASVGNGIHLFVNGSETAYAASIDAGMPANDDSGIPLGINCILDSGMAGAMDDVRVFGRVLSIAEVAQLAAPTP